MSKGLSPTQRTLAALRNQGCHADVVERYLQRPGMAFGLRKDLFGFIDIIAIRPGHGIVGVQSCGGDVAAHLKKLFDGAGARDETYEKMQAWLTYATLELWGWRKVKAKRGGKLMLWQPRVITFRLGTDGAIVSDVQETS